MLQINTFYLRLGYSDIFKSEEVLPSMVLDYNISNEVVGLEMLYLSKRFSNLNLSALQFEAA